MSELYNAIVRSVTDGDTLAVTLKPEVRGKLDLLRVDWALSLSIEREIRIAGLRAPESTEPGGPEARIALAAILFGETPPVLWSNGQLQWTAPREQEEHRHIRLDDGEWRPVSECPCLVEPIPHERGKYAGGATLVQGRVLANVYTILGEDVVQALVSTGLCGRGDQKGWTLR